MLSLEVMMLIVVVVILTSYDNHSRGNQLCPASRGSHVDRTNGFSVLTDTVLQHNLVCM